MAKKRASLAKSDLFAKTDANEESNHPVEKDDRVLKKTGRTVRLGIGLKDSEVEALTQISAETNFSRHALMRYAVRHFIQEYHAGNIQLEEAAAKPKYKSLKMD